jgi:predicted regulator of Ras-like GTPase activity (Roadblock/LC7/MglB family)
MPAPGADRASVPEQVRAELRKIRADVAGVCGSIVATNDGFLLSQDVTELEPTEIAALVATTRALASRTTLAAARGQFKETVTRGSDGYLAVYAAGHSATVAVIGSCELNVAMLRYRAREAIERIAAISSGYARWGATAQASPAQASPAQSSPNADSRQDMPKRLPTRRS